MWGWEYFEGENASVTPWLLVSPNHQQPVSDVKDKSHLLYDTIDSRLYMYRGARYHDTVNSTINWRLKAYVILAAHERQPYLALSSELSVSFVSYLEKDKSRYNGNAMYLSCASEWTADFRVLVPWIYASHRHSSHKTECWVPAVLLRWTTLNRVGFATQLNNFIACLGTFRSENRNNTNPRYPGQWGTQGRFLILHSAPCVPLTTAAQWPSLCRVKLLSIVITRLDTCSTVAGAGWCVSSWCPQFNSCCDA